MILSRPIAWLLVSAFLAACQPLPRPFAPPDKATANPLLTVKGGAGVAVLYLDGAPEATSRAVTVALIDALLERDIPAALSAGNRQSVFVYGEAIVGPKARGGHVEVDMVWHLVDPRARPLGLHRIKATPLATAWQSAAPEMVGSMAGSAADGIAALIRGGDDAVPQFAPGVRRVFLEGIRGPAGLDGSVLRKALRDTLPTSDVQLAEQRGMGDLVLKATITLGPPIGERRRMRLLWRLDDPKGREIGRLDQGNDVAITALETGWPAMASLIAQALTPGLRSMIATAR